MLHVDKDQLDAMGVQVRRSFEQRMVEHLGKFFPEQCQALTASGVAEAIAEGIECAAKQNLLTERDVCLYLDLMFILGRGFDASPALPWVAEILRDPAGDWPRPRIDRVFDAALAAIKAKAGL